MGNPPSLRAPETCTDLAPWIAVVAELRMSLGDLEATPLPDGLLEPQAAMAPAATTATQADMRDRVPMS